MLRVIKFVIDTKTYGLKIEPKIEGEMTWNITFSVTVIGQEIQKQVSVSRDSFCTCLMYVFVGIPRLVEASHSQALELSKLLSLNLQMKSILCIIC
jgi:hypothetical protein